MTMIGCELITSLVRSSQIIGHRCSSQQHHLAPQYIYLSQI